MMRSKPGLHTRPLNYTLDLHTVSPDSRKALDSAPDLEEPLQPPHLKDPLPDQHPQLENTPPLHPRVRALGRIPVCPFPHDDVGLLVFDLGEEFAQLAD